MSPASLLSGYGQQGLGLIFLTLIAYLYGSIPFAYLATYLFARQRLTQVGTGNAGVVSSFRTGGVPAVVLTLVGEISKAPVSVGLAALLYPGQETVKLLSILAAFVGTNFSLFLKGRGGRGSTMLMWSIALVSFPSFLILGAITGLCFLLARVDVRLKSLWYWTIPAVLYAVEESLVYLVFGLLVTALIYFKSQRSQDDFVYYGYVPDTGSDPG